MVRIVVTAGLFLSFVLALADAYTALMPKVKMTNGKCIHPMFNEKIASNQPYYPADACERHSCDSSRRTIHISGCGRVMPPPGCKAEYDRSLKYPGCCKPKFVCE
ncbi:hypothetical protein BIW11_09600 [Tropilaelaps mercedesae]|uniref:Single domain-containing protein n=1 Tax=Tropilaelaps mercedesae TaxID=418985 RepID=A0A1V9XJJ8_9ACAR|nr:hypothetical protein BIW11_09600 [Tropilaelaps mercedesae]